MRGKQVPSHQVRGSARVALAMHLAVDRAAQSVGCWPGLRPQRRPGPPPASALLYNVGGAEQTGPSLKGECREGPMCADTSPVAQALGPARAPWASVLVWAL